MRLLIKKPKKRYVKDLNREITLSKFEKHYVDESKDFHTKYGIIEKKDLQKPPGSTVKVGKEEFYILELSDLDLYKTIGRSPQTIPLKDLGSIMAYIGLTKDSVVVELGAGAGATSCFLSKYAKKVIAYDTSEKHIDAFKENVKKLGLKNITVKKADAYDPKAIKEKADVVVVDLPSPWKAMKTAESILKIGGVLVIYTPHAHQAQKAVGALSDSFLVEKTIENIERAWHVDEKRLRPKTQDFGHTAFLTFVRRLQ